MTDARRTAEDRLRDQVRALIVALQPFIQAAGRSIAGMPGRHNKCVARGRFTLGDFKTLINAVDTLEKALRAAPASAPPEPDWIGKCPRCGRTVLNHGDLCSTCERDADLPSAADVLGILKESAPAPLPAPTAVRQVHPYRENPYKHDCCAVCGDVRAQHPINRAPLPAPQEDKS
jgi:hypothetical protein